MHVKVSAGFYLKNKPKDHLGTAGETWTFGDGNPPGNLEQISVEMVWQLAIFHLNCGVVNSQEANTMLRGVANTLLARVNEVEKRIAQKETLPNASS